MVLKRTATFVDAYDGERSAKIVGKLGKELQRAKRGFFADKGEIIMGDYISTLDHPVLYVTDDGGGFERIKNQLSKIEKGPPVRGVNTLGFLEMLRESGILKTLGFRDNLTTREMYLEMCKSDHGRLRNAEEHFSFNQMVRFSKDPKKAQEDRNSTTQIR